MDIYTEHPRKATPSQILHMLAMKGGMDDDGYFYTDWLQALSHGDLLADLVAHVIKNKDDLSIAALYEQICIHVSGILDKEYDND